MAANFAGELAAIRYNVGMSIEGDESPGVTEEQPAACEDQFDDDLMRDVEARGHPNSNRQLSPPR